MKNKKREIKILAHTSKELALRYRAMYPECVMIYPDIQGEEYFVALKHALPTEKG
jgi:hypothetical protein